MVLNIRIAIKLLLYCSLFLVPTLVSAQSEWKFKRGCPNFTTSHDTIIHGDTLRAKRAIRPEDTVTKLIIRLGYIYGDTATRQEFWDNLLLGLRVLRFSNYKVVGYTIGVARKGTDYQYWETKGNKITNNIYDIMNLRIIKPGDRVTFCPTVQKDGANYTLRDYLCFEIVIKNDQNTHATNTSN